MALSPARHEHLLKRLTVVHSSESPLAISVVDNTAHIIGAVAWPVCLVVLAHMFRKELAGLINRIRSFKGLGVEASLDAFIRTSLDAIAPPDQEQEGGDRVAVDEVEKLVPATELKDIWTLVEKALDDVVGATPATSQSISVQAKLNALGQRGSMPTGLRSLLYELYRIERRARSAPGDALTGDSLRIYSANANKAIEQLRSITT